jgi:hypothetical protein
MPGSRNSSGIGIKLFWKAITQLWPPITSTRARAADRINEQNKRGHTIEFWSDFVKLTFPVEGAYVGEDSLFMDASSFGEIAVAPQHYHCF